MKSLLPSLRLMASDPNAMFYLGFLISVFTVFFILLRVVWRVFNLDESTRSEQLLTEYRRRYVRVNRWS
jgi:hypothetical protein